MIISMLMISGGTRSIYLSQALLRKPLTHEVKLLGFNINRDLRFKNHMESTYIKAGKKLNALARLCSYLLKNVEFL